MNPTGFYCIYQANCNDIRLSQHGIENHTRIKSIQFGLGGRIKLINNSDKEFFVNIKNFLPPSSYVTEQQIKNCVAKHYFTATFSSEYTLRAFPMAPGGGQDYTTMKKKDGMPILLTDEEKSDLAAIMKESKNDIEKALVICASTVWERSSLFTQRQEQLKVLLKIGANPNAIYEGDPVIFQTKHSSMFSLISKAGARWDVKNSKGKSTFDHAISVLYMEEAFCDLIQRAYEGDHKNLILEAHTDELVVNLAYKFLGIKSLECIKLLVQGGAGLEASFGGTPLANLVKHIADNSGYKGQLEAVVFLCQAGADPNKTVTIYSHETHFQGTIIHIVLSAVRYRLLNEYSLNIEDCKQCARELMNGKIKVDLRKNDSNGIGPLFKAAQLGWYDIFCLMLENGADPNEVHPTEGPILFSVTDPKYLECLIKANADLTRKNPKGQSIVQRIIQQPGIINTAAMDLLCQQKIDFNAFDSSDNSPMISILKSRHPELPNLIERLIKTGISVNDFYREGLFPLNIFLNECLDNNEWGPTTKSVLDLLLNAKAEIKKIPSFIYLILPSEIKQLLQERLVHDENFLTFISAISVKVIAGLRLSYSTIESQGKIEEVKNLVISSLKTCLETVIFWDSSGTEVSMKGDFISYLSEKLDNYLSKSIFFDPARGVIDQSVASNFQEDMNSWFAEIQTEYLKIRSETETQTAQQKLEQELSKSKQLIEKLAQEEKQRLAKQLEEKEKAASAAAVGDGKHEEWSYLSIIDKKYDDTLYWQRQRDMDIERQRRDARRHLEQRQWDDARRNANRVFENQRREWRKR